MVVMEAINVQIYKPFVPHLFDRSITFPNRDQLRPEVIKLIEGLHKEGYVHGDLWDANFLVSTDGGTEPLFKLIDFDWAGVAGMVRYPANVNRDDVVRPEGAIDGQLIEKVHDMEMLDQFLPAR